MGKQLTRLVYEGKAHKIEFYVKTTGEVLAEEWLESMPPKIQQRFAALFAWMGDHGKIHNEQKFKHLTGTKQIFEFKEPNGGRVLCFFFVGKRIILTHGFEKKSNKTPKSEINRAEELKEEFERRFKNHD